MATRSVADQAGPASLAFLRYFIGFCCLLPPTLLTPRTRVRRADLVPIALLGIGQFGILVVLLNYALQSIPSARAALIFATMPLLTMLLGAARGSEPVTVEKTVGVLLTILGVRFALGDKALQPSSAVGAWAGELAAFASALCGAVCSVLYGPYVRKYPTLLVSAVAMLASVGFLAVLASGETLFSGRPRLTAGGWLAVLFIGISSGVGYYLWLWALKRATPTSVTVFLALSPVTAAALAALLLGEEVSTFLISGLACVAFGLWLANRHTRGVLPKDASQFAA